MSALARLALRVATVEILRTDPVIAAAVGGRVYDSVMGDVDQPEPVPVIIVHSETTSGEGWSANNGGPPFDSKCDLVFEIIHVAKAEQDGTSGVLLPETDRELEAALDLIEWRVSEALAFSESALAVATRALVLKRISEFRSDRFSSDDVGLRIASRFLTMTVQMHEVTPEVFYPGDVLPSGPFANLPEPLRSLAPLFDPGSSARSTFEMVAAQLPQPSHGDALTAVDMLIRPGPQPRSDPTDGSEFGGAALMPSAP